MLKMALLAPMPNASDSVATAVNAGLRTSSRRAYRTSSKIAWSNAISDSYIAGGYVWHSEQVPCLLRGLKIQQVTALPCLKAVQPCREMFGSERILAVSRVAIEE